MRLLLSACLLAGALHATVIESISIDLSSLHSGSTLSGSVMLANPLNIGDSTSVPLTFSDPADYAAGALSTTFSVVTGTPSGDAFRFSTIQITNLANNKIYNLDVTFAATCATDLPCQATGAFEAN